jgi:hypothetical protein
MPTRKTKADSEPTGSGTVPGTEAAVEEQYTGPGAALGGTQVQPGVNDGLELPEKAAADAEELETTEADEELAATEEETEGPPVVTYHGGFGKREITKEQWEAAGVSGMPTTSWERRTGHRVPADVFSPQALQVLRQDPDFRVP